MEELQMSHHTTTAEIEASNVTNLSESSLPSSENGSESDAKVRDVDLAADERLARCLQEIENESANPDEIVVVDQVENESSDDATSVSSDNAASNNASLMDILAIIDDVDDVEQFLAAQRALLRTFSRDHEEDDEDSDSEEAEGRQFWMRLMRSLSMPPEEQDSRIPEECQVCLVEVRLNKRPCCEQAVCEDCLKQYVETQLVDVGIVRIGCPNPSCDRGMYQDEVRELLRAKPDLRDRYDRWMVDMNADPHRKTCPRCCKITDVEPSELQDRHVGKFGLQVRCSECELEWCFLCQAPWHQGLTCKKFRTGDLLLKQWAHQKIRPQEYNAQRCPKCKVYIQRTEGCDHMTCSRCDTEFCYRCGERRHRLKLFGFVLEDHDMRHSIIGCNEKYKPDQPVQRALARGGIFGAKVVGASVAMPVVIGLAAGAVGLAVAVTAVAAPTYYSYKLARLIHRRLNDKFD